MDTVEKIFFICFLSQGVCCRDFNISLPEKIEALSGSCVIIYCRFEINKTYDKDFTERATGLWLKDGTDVNKYFVFNSSTSSQDLHVQYAPKISPSSSCTRTDVTVCFCEVDGNPSPELEWHLSGRPVTNSSTTFISEERLSSTGLRSSITLHQSLTHTSTLQCVSNNTHGNASQLFHLHPFVASLKLFSVLIEVAVGALVVVMMMYVITYTCVRKPLQTRSEGATRSISTNGSTAQENEGESVYANKAMMSSAGAATAKPESIIYSSIVFKNSKPREVVSVSSLHADYSMVQDCSGGLAKTKCSIGEFSRAKEAQVIVSADVITKQTQSKQSEEELFVDSSQLCAQVKRRNP